MLVFSLDRREVHMKNNQLSFIKEFELAIVNIQHSICTLCIKFDTELKIEYFINIKVDYNSHIFKIHYNLIQESF